MKKMVSTGLTSVLTVVCLATMTRFLAQGLGPESFGAFSLVRRILSLLEPLAMLGAGISIARFVGLTRHQGEGRVYLQAGVVLSAASTGSLVFFGWAFSRRLTQLLFGTQDYHLLFLSMLVLIASYSCYVCLYAFYRGMGEMTKANIWQVLVIAIGPTLIAAYFHGPDQAPNITLCMSLLLGTSAFPLWFAMRLPMGSSQRALRNKIQEMFEYGWGRIPGGLLFGGVLSVGPLLAPHFTTLKETGYLVVGQSILRIVESGFEAFGRVALPEMAAILGTQGKAALRGRISDLLGMLFDLGIYSTIHTLIWTPLVLVLWLGTEYQEAAFLVRIMALSLTPYLAFATLRSVFDAIEVRAVATIYLTVAFLLTLLVSWTLALCGVGAASMAIGSTLGLAVLGSLFIVRICRDLHLNGKKCFLPSTLAFNLLLGLAAWFLQHQLQHFTPVAQLYGALVGEAVLGIVYFALLYQARSSWLQAVTRRVLVKH
jgi:O-antigen/teichoic acid export membrane protein